MSTLTPDPTLPPTSWYKRWYARCASPIMKICFWIVLLQIILSPFIYWAILNVHDSTDYFLQEVASAKKGADGRDYIYVGDPILIKAYNWRHLVNGTCFLEVSRVRQNVGGKYDGKKTTFQFVGQAFVGDGKIRQTSWPIPPVVIKVDESWFDDPDAEEQEMDIWTEGPYECNPRSIAFENSLASLA